MKNQDINKKKESSFNNPRPKTSKTSVNKSSGRSTFKKEEFNSRGARKPVEKGKFESGKVKYDNSGYPQKRSRPSFKSKSSKESAYSLDGSIRLNRYLSLSGICSRRQADEYIKEGLISVNNNIITEFGIKVMPGDIVKFNNEVIKAEKKVYLLLNKPKDYITTAKDNEGRKTVYDLIKGACNERIFPVGRLDRNSMGVLLLTNDGDLALKLSHPK